MTDQTSQESNYCVIARVLAPIMKYSGILTGVTGVTNDYDLAYIIGGAALYIGSDVMKYVTQTHRVNISARISSIGEKVDSLNKKVDSILDKADGA